MHDPHDLHTRNSVTYLATTRRRQLRSQLHRVSLEQRQVLVPVYHHINLRVLRGNRHVKLHLPRTKKDIFVKGPFYRGVQLWDELDADTQHIESHVAFMKAL